MPQLTPDELAYLNEKIVERLKFIQNAKTMTTMQKFNRGDEVWFKNGDETVRGRIIRLNRKTVSLLTDANAQWNVAPGILNKTGP